MRIQYRAEVTEIFQKKTQVTIKSLALETITTRYPKTLNSHVQWISHSESEREIAQQAQRFQVTSSHVPEI